MIEHTFAVKPAGPQRVGAALPTTTVFRARFDSAASRTATSSFPRAPSGAGTSTFFGRSPTIAVALHRAAPGLRECVGAGRTHTLARTSSPAAILVVTLEKIAGPIATRASSTS